MRATTSRRDCPAALDESSETLDSLSSSLSPLRHPLALRGSEGVVRAVDLWPVVFFVPKTILHNISQLMHA